MLALAASVAFGSLLSPAIQRANNVLQAAYEASYADRLMIGRRAQLGDDMIYRPGHIGCTVDSALTYGEYDLDFFCECMESALDGLAGPSLTFVDVGSGVGRLVLATALMYAGIRSKQGPLPSHLGPLLIGIRSSFALPSQMAGSFRKLCWCGTRARAECSCCGCQHAHTGLAAPWHAASPICVRRRCRHVGTRRCTRRS